MSTANRMKTFNLATHFQLNESPQTSIIILQAILSVFAYTNSTIGIISTASKIPRKALHEDKRARAKIASTAQTFEHLLVGFPFPVH